MRRRKNSNGLVAFLGLLALAIAVGFLLSGAIEDPATAGERAARARIENQARAEKLALDVKHKAALVPWITAGKVVGGALILAMVGGLALVGLTWAYRRACEIRPNSVGLFPVVRVRVGGAVMLFDPNRALAPVTICTPAHLAGQITVIGVPSGAPDAQERQAARATAVQLAIAGQRKLALPAPDGQRATPLVDDNEGRNWSWPARVPLSGLLNGRGASLSRLVLGVNVDAETGQSSVITGDMSRLVHVAVGGSSGWGKSMFLRALAYQLAVCPERPDLAMVDLEAVTFAPFARCERLLYPIADSESGALAVFEALVAEMGRRKELFGQHPGVDGLDRYNERASETLPPVVALIDEATALLSDKAVESELKVLAMRARKYGLWLVLGGQDWKASSLDTGIRNQLSARVQFKAMSASQSRVLLQQAGAESLEAPGRALAVLPGRGLVEIQAPLVSYDDIAAALTSTGPRNPLPEVGDASQDALIRQLHDEGLSNREIEIRVFGHTGGAAYRKVKQTLDAEEDNA